MCGGYICTHCGACGKRGPKRPALQPGICVRCGFSNEPTARVCKACGAQLVLPPGTHREPEGASGDGR